MHAWTEVPGSVVSEFTASVIATRYAFAVTRATPGRIAEIGCGAGIGLGLFNDLEGGAARTVGVEFSEENLALCRAYGRAPLLRADAADLPFADGVLSSVVSLAMVYYLDLRLLAAEVRRALVPGGTWVFCSTNPDVSGFVPAPHTTRYYSVPEMRSTLEAAGFEVEVWGAFPVGGGFPLLAGIRGVLKNLGKSIVHRLPGGRSLWARARDFVEVPVVALPTDVKDLLSYQASWSRLPVDVKDLVHRVYYVVATQKEVK